MKKYWPLVVGCEVVGFKGRRNFKVDPLGRQTANLRCSSLDYVWMDSLCSLLQRSSVRSTKTISTMCTSTILCLSAEKRVHSALLKAVSASLIRQSPAAMLDFVPQLVIESLLHHHCYS